jgi:hypothetical protein
MTSQLNAKLFRPVLLSLLDYCTISSTYKAPLSKKNVWKEISVFHRIINLFMSGADYRVFENLFHVEDSETRERKLKEFGLSSWYVFYLANNMCITALHKILVEGINK